MRLIQLSPIPNQSISFQRDQRYYELQVKWSGNQLLLSVARDNIALVSQRRLVPNALVLQKYQSVGDNFGLRTLDDELPEYTQLGISQFLYYLNESDQT